MKSKRNLPCERIEIINKLRDSKSSYEDFMHKNLELVFSLCKLEFCSINFITDEQLESCCTLGMDGFSISREGSLCFEAFNKKQTLVINDLSRDVKFKNNIFHKKEPYVHSYVGIPLQVNNFYIGTLCTYSSKANHFTEELIHNLKTIAFNLEHTFTLALRNNEYIELEAKYNSIQEFSKTGTWELDLLTQKTKWSEEVYKIHAIDHRERFDKNEGINFYAQHERERLTQTLNNSIQNKTSFDDVFEFYDANKTKKWVRSSGVPKLDKDGNVINLYGIFQDVTKEVELTNSKLSAQVSFSRLQKTLEQFFIISKTDLEGNIVYVNDKFCDISGYNRNELIGYEHKKVESGTHPKNFFKDMWKTISSGKPWQGNFCNKAKDGSHYWVASIIIPDSDNEGNIKSFTGIAYDISERMKLQIQAQSEKERASFNSQLAAIGELSAGIAHEISNPLMVIYGNVSLLKDPNLPAETRLHYLNKVKESVERINKITSGLLKVARQAKDEDYTRTQVNDLFDSFSDFYNAGLHSKNINLKVNLSSPDVFVDCNEVKLSQVFLNLINNSRDSIEESTPHERWVKIENYCDEKYINFIITDSGPGIPEEIKLKVTESFFTTKKAGKGNGLGLALVKRFVQEHQGYLKIVNIDNKNFIQISIPISQEESEAA